MTGLEPVTSSLPRKCSTTELQQHFRIHSKQSCQHINLGKRVKGIEPSYSAWKAAALPLSYTRKTGRVVGEVGLEPTKA